MTVHVFRLQEIGSADRHPGSRSIVCKVEESKGHKCTNSLRQAAICQNVLFGRVAPKVGRSQSLQVDWLVFCLFSLCPIFTRISVLGLVARPIEALGSRDAQILINDDATSGGPA